MEFKPKVSVHNEENNPGKKPEISAEHENKTAEEQKAAASQDMKGVEQKIPLIHVLFFAPRQIQAVDHPICDAMQENGMKCRRLSAFRLMHPVELAGEPQKSAVNVDNDKLTKTPQKTKGGFFKPLKQHEDLAGGKEFCALHHAQLKLRAKEQNFIVEEHI